MIPAFQHFAIGGRIYCGRNPLSAEDVEKLRSLGITHILDLRERFEWSAPGWRGAEAVRAIEEAGIERLNLPVEDGTAPAPEVLDRADAFLDDALRRPAARVFVHCRAGQERTGAILTAHLARRHGWSYERALAALQAVNPSIQPLPWQEAVVRRWLAAPHPARIDYRSRVRGCLLGGAIGDALGAGVEFDSLSQIRGAYGPRGVTGYVLAYGRRGAITDDTQMTLFTAEGLIRASVRQRSRGIAHPPSAVRLAYLRWLHTQGEDWKQESPLDGWLVRETALHAQRAPGNTCLAALRAGGNGTRDEPLNHSKGCGGVMRAAPAGLIPSLTPEEAFALGADCAAITHGHPSGYLSAGALAAAVRLLLDGEPLDRAVSGAAELLRAHPDHEETSAALARAAALAAAGAPSPENVESLGEGKVGEEALAIAVYCGLAAPDLRAALLLAVNHSGDSDSTGAICGNLVGALHGEEALPQEWLEPLELRATIERLADDFVTEMTDPPTSPGGSGEPPEEWWQRYPGW